MSKLFLTAFILSLLQNSPALLKIEDCLMTESGWDDSIDGKTYRNSHFSIASDNSEATAAHELGHMLGAKHNSSFSFWNWTASITRNPSN
jgi:hypothetical protein